MKKVKCPRCLQTKSHQAFKKGKVINEWCNDCLTIEEQKRQNAVKKVIIEQARKLGLIKSS